MVNWHQSCNYSLRVADKAKPRAIVGRLTRPRLPGRPAASSKVRLGKATGPCLLGQPGCRRRNDGTGLPWRSDHRRFGFFVSGELYAEMWVYLFRIDHRPGDHGHHVNHMVLVLRALALAIGVCSLPLDGIGTVWQKGRPFAVWQRSSLPDPSFLLQSSRNEPVFSLIQ